MKKKNNFSKKIPVQKILIDTIRIYFFGLLIFFISFSLALVLIKEGFSAHQTEKISMIGMIFVFLVIYRFLNKKSKQKKEVI
ncbi:MAG: hypothetical protein NT161_01855 [Candidatus Nomurabacteria bacterium]|nr:hypothetical protein [Candidatus Nomurabacteria bacterium]